MAIQTLSKINYFPKARFHASYPVVQFLSFQYMSERDRLSASLSHKKIYRDLAPGDTAKGEKTQKFG